MMNSIFLLRFQDFRFIDFWYAIIKCCFILNQVSYYDDLVDHSSLVLEFTFLTFFFLDLSRSSSSRTTLHYLLKQDNNNIK